MTAIKNGTLLVKDSNGNTARVATLSQTDITTLNTALTDIDANKRKISSISANYVTTNTAQTITGIKTFSTNSRRVITRLKITDVDSTVTPTKNLWTNSVGAYDKNDKIMGALQFIRTSDGNDQVGIQATNRNSNGSNINASIAVKVNNEGVATTYAPKPSASSNDNNIATTSWVRSRISESLSIGAIVPFAGAGVPAGFLLCNGAAISRTAYKALFDAIGTRWGAGDGSTTFNLPDARGRFPEGANGNLGAYHNAGLPNITGWFGAGRNTTVDPLADNVLFKIGASLPAMAASAYAQDGRYVHFNAGYVNGIYGKSTVVQPNSFCIQYLIKY